MRKKFFILIIGILLLQSSCITEKAHFSADYGNLCDQHFTPTSANFTFLGTFHGVSSTSIDLAMMDKDVGLVAIAKENLLTKIANAGIKMNEGSKFLTNYSIEKTTYENTVTITVSADVFEIK